MKLLHYSAEPLKEIKSFKQDSNHRGFHVGKPRGLWLSVQGKDDWEEWCLGESFNLEALAIATEIVLSPKAKLKYITASEELLAFTKEYSEKVAPITWRETVNWTRVAEKYQGIIIAPYIWECRLLDGTFWYYGWDCASGCIWDSSAISAVIATERHITLNERAA